MKGNSKRAVLQTEEAQKRDLAEQFTALAPKVTEEMINLAVVEEHVSRDTIKRYLKGNVRQVPVGKVLIANLSRKVGEKESMAA